MLKGEENELDTFAAETARLMAQLKESMAALELLQVQGAQAAVDTAAEIPALRCAFRKRCASGHSNAARLACSLAVLEGELSPKRRCASVDSTGPAIAL